MPGSIDEEYALNCTQYLIILAEGECMKEDGTCVDVEDPDVPINLCLSCHADEALKRMVREKEDLETMIEGLGEKAKA